MLELTNIFKSYGDKIVLDGFSLKIKGGERICLMGPSGGGKTTALRIACGLIYPDSGSVLRGYARSACVFQEDRLLPWYDALANLTCLGIDSAKAKSYLEKVGLTGEEHTLPEQLSGGMQRRLALARALAFGGDMYFFDEPLAGLDDATKNDVVNLLEDELKDKTALIVTHDADAAKRLASKIVYL